MTQMAKRYGARVLIDGAQTVAHVPVNVQQLGSDFFVFSGHKIFGPTGIGAVYAKEELLDIMPPWQGGGNMIRNVTFEETTLCRSAGQVRGRHAEHRRRRRTGGRARLRQPLRPAEHRPVRARTAALRDRAALPDRRPAADRHGPGKSRRAVVRAQGPADGGRRPAARSGGDRRAGRPPLLATLLEAFWRRGYSSAVAGLL